ncbi:MAG: hypothetical protein IPG76_02920 [Acidobacteria bacterium]|nr:hypothetical protein [Acidobacteriota bacterium]
MSKTKGNFTNKFKILLVMAALAIPVLIAGHGDASARMIQDLPEGEGVRTVRMRCIGCHEADLIISQRLSREGWVKEVDKMIRWGAIVGDDEKPVIVNYLAAHFGPKKESATGTAKNVAAGRGKEIFEARCLLCHELDLTAQQRLSRSGWTREVEKMMRWGAAVTPDEKEPLIDYLFQNYR